MSCRRSACRSPGTLSFFGSAYANLTDGFTRWVETVGRDYRPNGWVVKRAGRPLLFDLQRLHLGTAPFEQLFLAHEADVETEQHHEAVVRL